MIFCTVVAVLLMGATHGMLPFFDLRCSEMLAVATFLHVERQHLQEAWAQMHKFNMAAIFQHCGDAAKHSDCTFILWSADKLFILTT